jgi:dihydroflavonol-4-reductase
MMRGFFTTFRSSHTESILMRILITGATGFIGSHIAEALHVKGYKIRVLVRKTSKLAWLKDVPVEYVYGDFFSDEGLRAAVDGVDYIVHSAGVTKATGKEGYYRGNHLATRNILGAALQYSPKIRQFIHISSQAAVGPSINGQPVNEQTPYHPLTTYGKSKMEAEKECQLFMPKLPVTIIRPPAVYGPRDKDVFEFFNSVKKGLQPMIGFSHKLVSLIHVKDLVSGIVSTIDKPVAIGQIYFISSERYYNWREVGEITARVMGKRVLRFSVPVPIVYGIGAVSELVALVTRKPVLLNWEKAKDIVQDAWTCDVSKARKELDFKEKFTLEKGIQNTVEWYRKERWL